MKTLLVQFKYLCFLLLHHHHLKTHLNHLHLEYLRNNKITGIAFLSILVYVLNVPSGKNTVTLYTSHMPTSFDFLVFLFIFQEIWVKLEDI